MSIVDGKDHERPNSGLMQEFCNRCLRQKLKTNCSTNCPLDIYMTQVLEELGAHKGTKPKDPRLEK